VACGAALIRASAWTLNFHALPTDVSVLGGVAVAWASIWFDLGYIDHALRLARLPRQERCAMADRSTRW
jgi:hypothetical protein